MVGRSRRNCVGVAAARHDILERLLPALLEADPEARRMEADLRTHEARHQDVPHPVIRDIGPVHPVFLDEDTSRSPACAATAATWRVWLDWTPPMETRVSHPGEGVRQQVLQLADLVAAERQAGVAVLALGPDRGATEVLPSTGPGAGPAMDRTGAARQGSRRGTRWNSGAAAGCPDHTGSPVRPLGWTPCEDGATCPARHQRQSTTVWLCSRRNCAT